ncbi:MAG: UDP-N-acetylmuramoyl-L-alanyl-D-glutamate--2,6-diaminopimelate ligase [Rubripirellula sp.]|nr:UDP-N-acetylmuramoyl-L-alanyl-D-glutamate--2,6-diaminopimelate ligase [Rubripirellula sp.]
MCQRSSHEEDHNSSRDDHSGWNSRGQREGVEPNNASHESEATFSLRTIMPAGRFPADTDIHFKSVAESSSDSAPGQLTVYRIGQDCPSRVVAEATARGAAGILTEQVLPSPIPQCIVGDIDIALATIAAEVFDRPDRKLLNIAVVGSAGKTTSTLLIASLLRSSGIRTAYWNDLGDCDGIVQSTPKSQVPTGAELVNWLAEAVDNQCTASVVEISEELARHGKYDSVEFDMIVVTGSATQSNDFGPTGIHCVLECLASSGVVIAPADDQRAIRIIRETGVRMVTYGVRKAADVTTKLIEQADGLTTLIVSHRDTSAVMETPLCGAAMAANHAAAAMVGLLLDQPLHAIAERLGQLSVIPGRGQRLSQHEQPTAVLETGGTVDRVTQALRTHRSMKGHGKLWCVFAISDQLGSEDLADVGEKMERFADRIVVTSTPTNKTNFLARSHEILDGVEKCVGFRLVADRTRAVDWVMQEASANDTVVIFTNEGDQTAHQQRSDLRKLRRYVELNWQVRKSEAKAKSKGAAGPKLSIFG